MGGGGRVLSWYNFKRPHGHLGSWAQDAAVCGKTHTSRIPNSDLDVGGEQARLCGLILVSMWVSCEVELQINQTRPQPDLQVTAVWWWVSCAAPNCKLFSGSWGLCLSVEVVPFLFIPGVGLS